MPYKSDGITKNHKIENKSLKLQIQKTKCHPLPRLAGLSKLIKLCGR